MRPISWRTAGRGPARSPQSSSSKVAKHLVPLNLLDVTTLLAGASISRNVDVLRSSAIEAYLLVPCVPSCTKPRKASFSPATTPPSAQALPSLFSPPMGLPAPANVYLAPSPVSLAPCLAELLIEVSVCRLARQPPIALPVRGPGVRPEQP